MICHCFLMWMPCCNKAKLKPWLSKWKRVMPYALMHVSFLSPNSLENAEQEGGVEMRVFRVGFNLYHFDSFRVYIGEILAGSLKDRFSFSHSCTTVSAFLIFCPRYCSWFPGKFIAGTAPPRGVALWWWGCCLLRPWRGNSYSHVCVCTLLKWAGFMPGMTERKNLTSNWSSWKGANRSEFDVMW